MKYYLEICGYCDESMILIDEVFMCNNRGCENYHKEMREPIIAEEVAK